VPQVIVEGQLMGHPLSFPLLCVINLAVAKHACKLWYAAGPRTRDRKRQAALIYRNCLINGDDMILMGPNDFYPFFKIASEDAGFKLSDGKNYISSHTVMMNSQVFTLRDGVMKKCGYLNQKLFARKGAVQKTGESNATPTQISRELSRMVSLCPWTNCVVPAVLGRWQKHWFGKGFQPNWYLPVHLGGFGLDPRFGPAEFVITREQRKFAARFINDPKMALYRMPGFSIPVAKYAGAVAKWRMVPGPYVQLEGETSALDDEWLARIAYAFRASDRSIRTENAAFPAKFKPEYRLKPMSEYGIRLYWSAQLFASKLPICPPLNLLSSCSTETMIRPWMVTFVRWLSLAVPKAHRVNVLGEELVDEALEDDDITDFDRISQALVGCDIRSVAESSRILEQYSPIIDLA